MMPGPRIDLVAYQRALEVVRDRTYADRSAAEIARELRCTDRTVVRYRRELRRRGVLS